MRSKVVAAATSLLLALVVTGSASARLAREDVPGPHSDNIVELTHMPLKIGEGQSSVTGTDFGFQGKLVVAGSYQGIGLFKIVKGAPYLRQISSLACAGSQGDVSVYGHLVFMSVDSPRAGPKCDLKDTAAASQQDTAAGTAWEGVRIIDISNLKRPEEIATVKTDCGSHTHTLLPDGKVVYLYVQSYPLSGQGKNCNEASHRKISVIKVPLDNPTKASVVSTPSVGNDTIGCHDVTVVPARNIAIAACISESQIWDIGKPEDPKIIATIQNPQISIHHTSGVTWDGHVMALGDEFAGAMGNGCTGDKNSTVGAMWFYDLTDPKNPTLLGHYALPRTGPPDSTCTTHNYNIVPMRNSKSYIAVSPYYTGGMSIVDFSDPAAPKEYAYYQPMEDGSSYPNMWSSYWYNGLVYENGEDGLIRVFKVDGLSHKEALYFRGRLNPQTQIASFK